MRTASYAVVCICRAPLSRAGITAWTEQLERYPPAYKWLLPVALCSAILLPAARSSNSLQVLKGEWGSELRYHHRGMYGLI